MTENPQENTFSFFNSIWLELETQIIISKELRFTEDENFDKVTMLLEEVWRMLNSMTSKMKLLDVKR